MSEKNSNMNKFSFLKSLGFDVVEYRMVDGLNIIEAKAIILCMGCRERPRGALNIPGYRPAGIYSAGTAQR